MAENKILRFRLSTLLFILTVFAITICGWIARFKGYQNQIRKLRTNGVSVTGEAESIWQVTDAIEIEISKDCKFEVWKDLAGLNFNSLVVLRRQSDPRVWICLKELKSIQHLEILEGDNSLVEVVSELNELNSLRISGLEVTKLPDFANFSELTDLDISYTNIAASEFHSLACFQSLEVLDLTGTDVTDQALAEIVSAHENILKLYIDETEISPASFDALRDAKSIQLLSMRGTQVPIDSTESVSKLSSLQLTDLRLSNLVTDSNGVPELRQYFPKAKFSSQFRSPRNLELPDQ